MVSGETDASRALLGGLPGVFTYDRKSSREEISAMLNNVARYDPVAGWPQRRQWLLPKTWTNIFAGIFDRYL